VTLFAAIPLFVGFVSLVEMTYHFQLESDNGTTMRLFGVTVDTATPMPWIVTGVLLVAGGVLVVRASRHFRRIWDGAQSEIQAIVEAGRG
jgi:branched-chain amino acid transport system permease protein